MIEIWVPFFEIQIFPDHSRGANCGCRSYFQFVFDIKRVVE